jgi:hypothetical protein
MYEQHRGFPLAASVPFCRCWSRSRAVGPTALRCRAWTCKKPSADLLQHILSMLHVHQIYFLCQTSNSTHPPAALEQLRASEGASARGCRPWPVTFGVGRWDLLHFLQAYQLGQALDPCWLHPCVLTPPQPHPSAVKITPAAKSLTAASSSNTSLSSSLTPTPHPLLSISLVSPEATCHQHLSTPHQPAHTNSPKAFTQHSAARCTFQKNRKGAACGGGVGFLF